MKNRIHLFVSPKNVLLWLMALCMTVSVVSRILVHMYTETTLWRETVLPIAAGILYLLIVFLDGGERFYKTAIPVWMMAAYGCFLISIHVPYRILVILFWLALCFLAFLYTDITSGRWSGAVWCLVFVVSLPLGCVLYFQRERVLQDALPDVCMLLGVLLTCFAIRIHPAGQYHPTWGDRPDGRRLRSLPPIDQIGPYLMVNRNESNNLFAETLEITNVDRYIRQKRREGLAGFGINHVLLAAYVRTLCRYPALNRFLSGQKLYSRGEDIQYCMTIKKQMSVDAPDTVIKVHLNPADTVDDVYRKLQDAIAQVRNSSDLDSNFDNTAGVFAMIPGVVLKFTVWVIKVLDYFGLLPKFLLEVSPFHGSIYFTSMGSLGIPPVFHHLYNFGNLPVFGAFGVKRRVTELAEDGSLVQRKYVDVKFTLDERIADGYYYAAFFKHFKRILQHPEILDQKPEEILRDVD